MEKKILVTIPVNERQLALLQAAAPDHTFLCKKPQEVTAEDMEDLEILVGNVAPERMAEGKRLAFVQLNSAGADVYCKPGILPEGTVLCCATGAYGLAIAECLLTLTLMLCKKMDLYAANQAEHRWFDEGRVSSVWGSTTLIIGLGDIGSEYALRMKALGSRVIGIRRHPGECPDYLDAVGTPEDIDRFLPEADFVALALPNRQDTVHLMDERRLALMKPTAFLLNVGRGSAVDCEALNEALRKGIIGGAGLDVTEPEPLPADHPLWDAPHLILTPHSAGKFNLPETFERIVRIGANNLKCFLSEDTEHMTSIVDRTSGYRRV